MKDGKTAKPTSYSEVGVEKLVMWLGVDFKYEEDKILAYGVIDGEPIVGNQIYLKLLGQEFIENFVVSQRTFRKEEYRRMMAKMFGMKLQEIGKMIERQAEFGKPSKMVVNGKEIITF